MFTFTTTLSCNLAIATTGVQPCSKAGCEPDEECQVDEKGMPQCVCPGPCPPIHRPVCGSDQRTYSSNCDLQRESCLQKRSIKLLYEGVCGKFRLNYDRAAFLENADVKQEKPDDFYSFKVWENGRYVK